MWPVCKSHTTTDVEKGGTRMMKCLVSPLPRKVLLSLTLGYFFSFKKRMKKCRTYLSKRQEGWVAA